MKQLASHFAHLVLSLAVAFFLPTLAAGQTVLFEDDFNEAFPGEQPTIPPWSIIGENAGVGDNYILVQEDWGDIFGAGGTNRYMQFHGTDLPLVIAADLPESTAEVVTLSFDFVEPDDGKDGPLIVFVYSGDGTARAERVRLTSGGTGAGAPAPGSRVYQLDTLNRVDWIVNNSAEPITYLSGARTIDSDRADLWINGNLILSNQSAEPNTNLGPIRAFDIRTFSGTNAPQQILIDNVSVVEGAHFRAADAPEPLMEFLFEGGLVNTGSVGGEGTFVHERESDPTYNYVWANRASIGEGLSGEPNSGLDNTQVGGMGDYGQGDVREGGFFFPSDGLHNLQSVTIASWYKTPAETPWSSNAFMTGWPNAMDYQHQAGETGTRVLLNVPYESGEGEVQRQQFSLNTRINDTLWQQFTERWTFQAVTFDSTTGTMSFYYGYEDSDGVIHNTTRSDMPIGPLRDLRFDVAFANNYFGVRPLKAHLDNVRVFGSTEDGSGALSHAALINLWAQDLGLDAEPPALPEVKIVEISHDGNAFTVSFETEPGFTYTVEASPDLVDWSDVQYTVEGDGTVKSHTDSTSTGLDRRFYRVRVAASN